MTVAKLPDQVPPSIIASGQSGWEKVAAAATTASAVVVAVSVIVAWCAWRSEVERSSKRNVAEFITSVTTGPTAEARDHLGTVARRGKSGAGGARTRHSIFEILWALDRASALASDVDHVDDVYRKALRHHVTQMTDSLGNLPRTTVFANIGWFAKPDYNDSVNVAIEGLEALGAKIGDPEHIEQWVKDLSNLKSIEVDSQSAEAATTNFTPCYASGRGLFTKLCEKVRGT
ncbi:MAG: hypothetical protein ACI38U_07800 [Corynebacterium sp.]|uniref:hypothetical protein n=1 Tax=Corynebacterium sp. TaxID=1720 RepID=UPI003F116C75